MAQPPTVIKVGSHIWQEGDDGPLDVQDVLVKDNVMDTEPSPAILVFTDSSSEEFDMIVAAAKIIVATFSGPDDLGDKDLLRHAAAVLLVQAGRTPAGELQGAALDATIEQVKEIAESWVDGP